MKKLSASIIIAMVSVMLWGCGSSRPAVRADGGKSTSPPKRDYVKYEDMKEHVAGMQFADDILKKIVMEAREWIGTPYRYGGVSRKGVDCSGLVLEVYKASTGSKLPRSSAAQQSWCLPVDKDSLQVGDLVFFATGRNSGKVSHVGIYIGGGEMIHASSSSGVIVSPLRMPYFAKRYHSAGRPPFLNDYYQRKGSESKPKEVLPQPVEPLSNELDEMIDAVVDSVFTDFFN